MRDTDLLPPKELSVGMVLVHHDGERFRFLCLRNFESWDFPEAPAGEEDDPLQAAIDTVSRMTGIENPALHWGEEYRETLHFEDGRVSRFYLAESPTADVELALPAGAGAEEDYEYRWATLDEVEDLLPPRLALVLDWAVSRLARKPAH